MKKNNLLNIIVLILLLQLTTHAQTWSFYKDYPVNISPWMADSDNLGNLYMLTSSREIWKKNSSNSWNKFPDFPASNFFDMKVNENTEVVYLADEFQGLVYSANDGVSWEQAFLETSPLSGFHESVTTLSKINNSFFFYGGGFSAIFPYKPCIFKYTTTGNTVSNILKIDFDVVVNFDNIPATICYTSDGSKILVGTVANGIWVSTDGGLNFQNFLSGNEVYNIVLGSNNSFYALTRNLASNQNQLLKSTDGVSWSVSYTNPDPNDNFTTLYFDESLSNLWLGTEKIIYKISNLDSATPVFQSQNLNNTEQRVVSIVKSNGIIHQFSSEFIVQNQANNSWILETDGLLGSSSQVLFDASNTLYSLDYSSPVISKSITSGAGWMNFYVSGNIQAGLENLNKDTNGNVFFTKQNKLFKMNTSNNLQEINVPNPNATFISKLYVATNGNIYLSHSNEANKLYRSINGGQTWQMIFESPNFSSYDSICENEQGMVFFTLQFNQAELHYSIDNAQTWDVFNYDFSSDAECGSAFTSSIYSSGNSTFLTVCLKTFLLQLVGNNVNLTQINFPNGSFSSYILSNTNGFYTVSDDDIIYKSSDNGLTWLSMSKPSSLAPFPNSVYSFLYTNSANEVFVQTNPWSFGLPENLRGLYKLTETLDLPANNNFEVVVFPNPASNYIQIQSNEVITSYQLYDMLGKNININSTINNQIDISHLTTGVYFLQLKINDGRQNTFKIIKD